MNKNGKLLLNIAFLVFAIPFAYFAGKSLIGGVSNSYNDGNNAEVPITTDDYVTVYYAKQTIQPREKITDDLIAEVKLPVKVAELGALTNKSDIVDMHANYNTMIPKGSMFYKGTIVPRQELADISLLDIPKGYTLAYMPVTMLTSYTNSILPENYIDIYISTKNSNGMVLVGKLLQNVKILAVKTSDGLNVFENSNENRIPSIIQFALPNEQYILLKQIDAINKYSTQAKLDLAPVPINMEYKDSTGKTIEPTVDSKYFKDYIENISQNK